MSESTGYSIDEILADVKKITESTEIDPLDELFGGTDAEEKGFSADAQIIENSEEETVFDDIEKENKEPVKASEDTEPETQETETETSEEEEITVYDKKDENDDFSFQKMFEEKKKEKELVSRTKVFKKTDENTKVNAEAQTDAAPTEEISESEAALEKEFKEKRKEKIDKFRLFAENLGEADYSEDDGDAVTVSEAVKPKKGEDIFSAIENTDKPKKENSKRREKRKRRDSKVYDKIDVGRVKLRLDEDARQIKIRTVVTAVSFVLCLIFGAMKTLFVGGKLGFLSALMGENSIIAYAVEFILGLPVLAVSVKALIDNMKNSERPALSSEAMVTVILAVNTVHNAILILTRPEMNKSVMFFGTGACFIALLDALGRKKENTMIKKNLEALTRNERIMGVFALENESEKLASGISKAKEPMVLCAGEVEIPNSFLDSSLTKDKETTFFNIAVPASLILSAVCGAIAYVSYGTVTALSSAVVSALLISAPAFISPVLVSLIARVNESLNRTGCEILGYEDVENIDDTDAIVLDTADIFTGNISHFHLVSRSVRIDTLHAFEIACSVLYASGGVLKGEIAEFMKEQKLVLPEVEDIKYEEKLGISCWVEDKCVLLGTEKMMREHNIEIPPEYSGAKYEKEGSKVFYLAVDTYATAMFCADYFIGRQAKKQLVDLYKTGVILMLMTTDPHIDEQFVANTLGVSASSIKTVSPIGAKKIRDSISATTKQKRTGLIFRKSVVGLLKVINSAFRLYDVQSLAILIQIVSMVFAIVVSGVLSAAATGYLPGVIFIIAYHGIWTALGYLVTHKNKK